MGVVATQLPEDVVDDLYLAIVVENIDGGGRLFAEATQSRLRSATEIIAGYIRIDPNDIDTALSNNIFEDLMVHELGHGKHTHRSNKKFNVVVFSNKIMHLLFDSLGYWNGKFRRSSFVCKCRGNWILPYFISFCDFLFIAMVVFL